MVSHHQRCITCSGCVCGVGIGIWLYLWWLVVAVTSYVCDLAPVCAFASLYAVSLIVTLLKLIWRRSWFLTVRARFCANCCSFSSRAKVEEKTLKQHSPWRKQFSLFFEMASPYFRDSRRGRWLFVGMMFLTLIDSAVNVDFSYTSKEFYNALEKKDAAVFRNVLMVYTSILIGGAPVTAFYNFQRQRLAVAWREWMTERTLNLYLNQRVYYLLDKDIDNPDQRIAQDVNAFTTYSLSLLVTLLDNTINLISMSVILYTIEPQLFLVIIVYTFVGTVVSLCLGSRLVPLNFERLRYEADLRHSLVRLREHAESIAFYRGESVERSSLARRLDRARGVESGGCRWSGAELANVYSTLPVHDVGFADRSGCATVLCGAPWSSARSFQARSAVLQLTADSSMHV